MAAAAHDFPAAFEIILQVLPGTKTIAIVNGASPNEAFWQGVLQRELEPLSKRVKIKWYNELSFEEMLKDAANLPPNSAIFWHLLSVDAAGVAHEANAALHRFSAAANAPIFSYLDVWFGEAILGGSMQSAQEGSAVAAAAAFVYSMVKRPVTSKFRLHISHRRGSTGDKCSALGSATATFRGEAKSTSENQPYGSGIRSKSRSLS